MDVDGNELGNLNEPQETIPPDAIPNVGLSFVVEIEGLAEQISNQLKALKARCCMDGESTTDMVVAIGVLDSKLHIMRIQDIYALRKAFE